MERVWSKHFNQFENQKIFMLGVVTLMKQSNQQNWAATNLFFISSEEFARIGLCTMKIKATSIIITDQQIICEFPLWIAT
jgi:hypothetical protein